MSLYHLRVCIIILNWNSWQDTIECLESVYRSAYPLFRVVVVDNCSSDNSIENIKMWANGKIDEQAETALKRLTGPSVNKPVPYIEYEREAAQNGGENEKERLIDSRSSLVLVKNDSNLGFTGGNNVGIRYAVKRGFDYVLLLNNDTVIDKDLLKNMLRSAELRDKVGIIGGKIYYYNRPDIIQSVGSKIDLYRGYHPHIGNKEVDRGQYDFVNNVDFVSGALMLVKKEVFDTIGLLDERYFLYVEEVDFCYRAVKAGFTVIVEPHATIWHKTGTSSGGELAKTFLYYSFRNRLLFIKKHFPDRCFLLMWPVIIRCFFICIKCVARKKHKGIVWVVKGIIDGIA